MSSDVSQAPKANLNIHFNAPSVRFDAWGRLRNAAARLTRLPEGAAGHDEAKAAIAGLLDELEPIEAYWGFPGRDVFARLVRQFADRQYVAFHHAVLDLSDQLDSGAYRQTAVEQALRTAAPGVHYFDLLVVSQLTADEERALRRELSRWRGPHDPFVYNLVVVNSYVDALVAVMFNF